jgi:endonuclease/exonuclease/phosphatase (EEP) superfamily protein YafD
VVALLAVIGAATLRVWAATVVAGFAAVVLLLAIAPRVIGSESEVSEGRPLRVMSANLLRGKADAAQLLEMVRDHRVEILAVQEFTPEFERRFREAGIEELLPHSSLAVRPGVIGSGIYSRYPLQPGPRGEYVTQTRATVTPERGPKLAVLSAHPSLPSSPGNIKAWEKGLRGMPDPNAEGAVWLLLGDFNATLDHAEFRDLLDRGYGDAGEQTGAGLIPTWPAIDRPFLFMPVTIDHLLYDRDRAGVREYEVLDLEGSDHRTLFAELVIGS